MNSICMPIALWHCLDETKRQLGMGALKGKGLVLGMREGGGDILQPASIKQSCCLALCTMHAALDFLHSFHTLLL